MFLPVSPLDFYVSLFVTLVVLPAAMLEEFGELRRDLVDPNLPLNRISLNAEINQIIDAGENLFASTTRKIIAQSGKGKVVIIEQTARIQLVQSQGRLMVQNKESERDSQNGWLHLPALKAYVHCFFAW